MAKSKTLSAAQIFEADDSSIEWVDVPEWGGGVFVKNMSGEERDAYEQSCMKKDGREYAPSLDNMRAKLLVQTVVDEDGKRLFTDSQVAKLGAKSARAIQRVYNVASKLNGITDADIEELAGNSEREQNASSG